MLPLRPVIKTTLQVIRATREAIKPFTEMPPQSESQDIDEKERAKDSGINASDLFSIFTANIVKQEVVFTR